MMVGFAIIVGKKEKKWKERQWDIMKKTNPTPPVLAGINIKKIHKDIDRELSTPPVKQCMDYRKRRCQNRATHSANSIFGRVFYCTLHARKAKEYFGIKDIELLKGIYE